MSSARQRLTDKYLANGQVNQSYSGNSTKREPLVREKAAGETKSNPNGDFSHLSVCPCVFP